LKTLARTAEKSNGVSEKTKAQWADHNDRMAQAINWNEEWDLCA
jgi:hypothetical protein